MLLIARRRMIGSDGDGGGALGEGRGRQATPRGGRLVGIHPQRVLRGKWRKAREEGVLMVQIDLLRVFEMYFESKIFAIKYFSI